MPYNIVLENNDKILLENTDGVKIELTSKNVIGEQAWHVFDNGISLVYQECTPFEYDALALSGSSAPVMDGYVWKHSYKDWKYDTLSGRLEDGCFIIYEGKYLVKESNKQQAWVDAV